MTPVAAFPDTFVLAVGISPNYVNDHTLFAAGYHGLYKSKTAGNAWTYTTEPARIEESQSLDPDLFRLTRAHKGFAKKPDRWRCSA